MNRFWAIIPAALLVLILLRPIHDVDIFWQLALGEQGGLLKTEPFLATKLGEPMIPAYWLGQVILASVKAIGGWRLLTLIDAVMWLGGFLLVTLSKPQASAKAKSLTLVGGFLTAIAFQSIRPQSFAVLLFGALVLLRAKQWSLARTLLFGIPLLVLWQNLHPSVLVAMGYLGVCVVTGVCQFYFRKHPFPTNDVVLMVIAGLAVFATPAGASILSLSANNAAMSSWLRTPEWMSLLSHENWRTDVAGTWIGLLAFVAVLCLKRNRLSLATVLPALAFAILTLSAFRFALFFGLTLVPVLIEALNEPSDERPSHRFLPAIAIGIVLALFAFIPVSFDKSFPFKTIEEMKASGPKGPVYCHRTWGSLLPGLVPGCLPSHDGRMYLFTQSEWEQYQRAANGEIPIIELQSQFRPVAWLLRPGFDDGLIDLLMSQGDGTVTQLESAAILFRK